MIEIKDLFAKSILGGICLGAFIVSSGIVENEILGGILVGVGFLCSLELGYPLLTERCGDARLMTTFMGYVTPDTMVLRLITRRVIPGNFLGILVVSVLGLVLFPGLTTGNLGNTAWWMLLIKAILAGIIVDLGTRTYRKEKSGVILITTLAMISIMGLNHILTDIPKVLEGILYGDISWGTGLKVILLSTIGNFVGTRIRTLIIKDNENN